MKSLKFEDFTSTVQIYSGEYECSCDYGFWSVRAKSLYGANEDGRAAFDLHVEDGFYFDLKAC